MGRSNRTALLEGMPRLSKLSRHANLLKMGALLAWDHFLHLREHFVNLDEFVLDDAQHWQHISILQIDS